MHPTGRTSCRLRRWRRPASGRSTCWSSSGRRNLLHWACLQRTASGNYLRFPARIGVVTSETGAVIHDIRNVVERRYPVEIIISPTAVQGEGAYREIAAAIRRLAGRVDVIIVARGGGSFEDLFEFNHPDVVKAIAACPVPVVSAIGHEVDVTLADLAADVRAPTPSAAAELVVPDRNVLSLRLQELRVRMNSVLLGQGGMGKRGDLRSPGPAPPPAVSPEAG